MPTSELSTTDATVSVVCSNCGHVQTPRNRRYFSITHNGKPICKSWRACVRRNGTKVPGRWDFLGKRSGPGKDSIELFNRNARYRNQALYKESEVLAEHQKGAHDPKYPWAGCQLCVQAANDRANAEAHQIYVDIVADRSYL